MNKHKWEGRKYQSEKDDWKKFEKNNVTITLNVLYAKNIYIYIYILGSNSAKQVIFSMISNGEKMALSCS